MVSSSGMSSLLFKDASTLHSFAGIGTCSRPRTVLLEQIKRNEEIWKRWADLEVLIIDEGSQISAKVFETVEYIARHVKEVVNGGSGLPFGGIQVIISADFYQLPPVKSVHDPGNLLFQSEFFWSMFPHIITLTETVRQNEADFIGFLSRLAEGNCSERDVQFVKENLSKSLKPEEFSMEFIPKIACTNEEICYENYERMEGLEGE